MSEWPLVTVVVPAFNAVATLDQALDSVAWQGYAPLEVLVVDDGSEDGTLALLERPREGMRVLRQEKKGPAAARNLALQQARGEYIAFLDADDIWLPGKLHAQVSYLMAHPDVDVVFGHFERWEAPESGGDWRPVPPRLDYERAAALALQRQRALPPTTDLCGLLYADLLLESKVHIITAMVRKNILLASGGFDEGWATGSDYEMWLRLSRQHRMAQIDQSMAWYRIHHHSITRKPRKDNAEYAIVRSAVSVHGLQGPDGRVVGRASLKRRLFAIAFGHGYMLYWGGHRAWAHDCFTTALRHEFFHPKAWVYWCLSWPAALSDRVQGVTS